jgi:Family of unknown function (DUF6228)
MSSLTIGSDPSMQVNFHSRVYADDGWLYSYVVELSARDFRASVRVENPGFGHPPTQLFQELVPYWTGWKGQKSWRSLEGELEIDATCDLTGHITLLISIPANGHTLWSAQAGVLIEAGQLEAVARSADIFFARRAV